MPEWQGKDLSKKRGPALLPEHSTTTSLHKDRAFQ